MQVYVDKLARLTVIWICSRIGRRQCCLALESDTFEDQIQISGEWEQARNGREMWAGRESVGKSVGS